MHSRKIRILDSKLTNKKDTWLMSSYNPNARKKLKKARKNAKKSMLRNGR